MREVRVRVTREGEWVGFERIQRANAESERKQGPNLGLFENHGEEPI